MADDHPCVMRETLFNRLAGAVLFGGTGLVTASGALLLLTRPGPLAVSLLAAFFFVPAAVFFLGYAVYSWTWRIELSADRITKHYGFWSRTIEVSQLRGGRNASERVILESSGGVKIAMPHKLLARLDPAPAWLENLINLDAQEYQESVGRLGADEGFGATPEARFEYLARLHRIGFYLMLGAFALLLWALIWPHPLALALAATAALTVLAIALVLTGRFRIDPRTGNSDVRPSLFYCLFLPSLALGGRAFHDWNLLDVPSLLEWSAAIAVALTAVLALRSAALRRHGWPVVICVTLLTAWCAGGLCAIDVMADTAAMAKYPVKILAVRRSDHFDYVTVPSWGPRQQANEVRIPGHMEPMLKPGARVCVYMGRGRLGWAWYALGDC